MTAWLWLYGPPGVGKSATGFELYEQLVERDERVAFVELDQIGMCMPAPLAARSAAKAHNLLGMLDRFAAAGADGVIVSGDIVETMRDVLSRARTQPVLCRMRASDAVTLERLTIRESTEWAMSSSVYESYGPPPGDLDVATHPLGVDEVAAEILRQLADWPPASPLAQAHAHGPPITNAALAMEPSSAILVTGPRAVGTSTVAWQVLMASTAEGSHTGYLDLEQLGFLSPTLQDKAPATRLAHVATCWRGFREQGATRLVLCGHVNSQELDALRQLLPSLHVAALAASPDTLLERAQRRAMHRDIWLPGDDLFGRDDDDLRKVLRQTALPDAEQSDVIVETDDLGPAEVARRITHNWPAAS